MNKPKLLCILHYAPPAHGASKVGDFIRESKKLNNMFECRFIKIKSSDTISDIGKINIKKIYYMVELFFKVLWALLIFRPDKIYITTSVRGVAFYRDLFISILWKVFSSMKNIDIFYHYHTKGIDNFVSKSKINLMLTRRFLNNINLILLSPLLEKDFEQVDTYQKVYHLPNGVEDSFIQFSFDTYIDNKFQNMKDKLEVLYLSNMIKSKGYYEVLKLANDCKEKNIHFNFAGGWQNKNDEEEFFNYIKSNNLEKIVTFYGFVNGDEKRKLFEKANFFIFPTRYENEAFPLSILESLSYGVPVMATDEGSIPYILDDKCGIILNNVSNLANELNKLKTNLINKETAIYCRQRYLDNFSLDKFEDNLIRILK